MVKIINIILNCARMDKPASKTLPAIGRLCEEGGVYSEMEYIEYTPDKIYAQEQACICVRITLPGSAAAGDFSTAGDKQSCLT